MTTTDVVLTYASAIALYVADRIAETAALFARLAIPLTCALALAGGCF